MSERVVVPASRGWTDPRPIFKFVQALSAGSEVIVGGAKGGDALVEAYARQRDDQPKALPQDVLWVEDGEREDASVLVRIEAPHFVAGIVAVAGCVVRVAPILAYMHAWDGRRVASYCRSKGWAWTVDKVEGHG